MTLSMRVGYAVVRPQKWPGRVRHRLRALRHGKLRLLRLIGARSVRSSYGVRLAANWGDRTFKRCAVGRYGTVLSDFIASIDEPFEFLDIGANQGLYALLAGRNPACTRAIAFEPVARTHGFLRRNIALNDLAERVTPVQAAVSQRRGTAEIALPDGHSGAASLCRGHDRARAETITLIDNSDLDQLLSDQGPKIVVKIDTEGHEPEVIAALMRTRAFPRIEAIFYEVDEAWVDAPALRAQLCNAGFTQFRRVGSGRHYDVLAQR